MTTMAPNQNLAKGRFARIGLDEKSSGTIEAQLPPTGGAKNHQTRLKHAVNRERGRLVVRASAESKCLKAGDCGVPA
jgi:hypothetical protein